jgi:hypothetical protein
MIRRASASRQYFPLPSWPPATSSSAIVLLLVRVDRRIAAAAHGVNMATPDGYGGVKVSDEQIAQIRLRPHTFHGDWNYTIKPAS